MAEKVTTTHLETVIDATSTDVQRLIALAREGDEIDDSLTIKQALRKYKVAVFWALALSTALIMEGYDLVMVRRVPPSLTPRPTLTDHTRSTRSLVRNSFSSISATL
jgi:hypothetical protein